MSPSKPSVNNGRRLDNTLSNWQDMPFQTKPTLLNTFSSGLNHQTHLISDGDQAIILKLFSKPNPSAIAIQKFAANHHLAPNILYANPVFDVALMEHINDDTLTPAINSQDLRSLGNAIKTLHLLPTKLVSKRTGHFDLLDYYQTYLSEIDTNKELILSIHDEILPVIDVFLDDKTPLCVCHNDLVKENCFVTEARAQFIDWEYAQLNNPWFDISTVIYSLELNQQQAAYLIETYNPSWLNAIATPIYFAAQCAMLWCDILWNLTRGQNLQTPELNKKLTDLLILKDNVNRHI